MAKITETQQEELNDLLANDILLRYYHSEYWDNDIIEEYHADNNIDKD